MAKPPRKPKAPKAPPELSRERFETVFIAPDQLVANPRNPRVHPASQISMLAESLRRFGQTYPVIARRANKMIIAGHGVREAALEAGLDRIEVRLWDVDQKTADGYLLADNRLGDLSNDDEAAVKALLAEFEDDWLPALGFDLDGKPDDDDADLGADLEIREIDTSPVADTFYVTVRGPLELQSKALDAFKALEREHPALEVLLGTSADG